MGGDEHVGGLEGGAAVRYAKRWAYGRNPAFYDYERIGGDCTNFASQCVYAGPPSPAPQAATPPRSGETGWPGNRMYSAAPAFYDYERIGGDCTNFASQCVYAGSGVMNYTRDLGWYYIDANNKAPAWVFSGRLSES